MAKLFANLLEKADTFYACDPYPLLQLVLLSGQWGDAVTLGGLVVSMQTQARLDSCLNSGVDARFIEDVEKNLSSAIDQIIARCAGLIHFEERDLFGHSSTRTYGLAQAASLKATLIHRTARDFLIDDQAGRAFVSQTSVAEEEARLILLRSSAVLCLALRSVPLSETPDYIHQHFETCAKYACLAVREQAYSVLDQYFKALFGHFESGAEADHMRLFSPALSHSTIHLVFASSQIWMSMSMSFAASHEIDGYFEANLVRLQTCDQTQAILWYLVLLAIVSRLQG
jgi:hypothetical protein